MKLQRNTQHSTLDIWMLGAFACISAAPAGQISMKSGIGSIKTICREIPNFVNIANNKVHFTWKHLSTFYCRRQHVYSPQKHCCATLDTFMLFIATCSSTILGRRCCVSISTTVRRTRHNVTSYIHRLPCSILILRPVLWTSLYAEYKRTR